MEGMITCTKIRNIEETVYLKQFDSIQQKKPVELSRSTGFFYANSTGLIKMWITRSMFQFHYGFIKSQCLRHH